MELFLGSSPPLCKDAIVKIKSWRLDDNDIIFCRQVWTGLIGDHATHLFLSLEMGVAPIPDDKNMHRCRQVRTDLYTKVGGWVVKQQAGEISNRKKDRENVQNDIYVNDVSIADILLRQALDPRNPEACLMNRFLLLIAIQKTTRVIRLLMHPENNSCAGHSPLQTFTVEPFK